MTYSYVLLDNSGSMARFRYPISGYNSAELLAQAHLTTASAANPVGLISFGSRVTVESHYSTDPGDLLRALENVPPPWGTTELVDAIMVSLSADVVAPNKLFIISDKGENTSEFSMADVKAAINAHAPRLVIDWIIPRPPPAFRPIPKFLAPPFKPLTVLKDLGARVIDLSKFTEESKFLDAVNQIHEGRFVP